MRSLTVFFILIIFALTGTIAIVSHAKAQIIIAETAVAHFSLSHEIEDLALNQATNKLYVGFISPLSRQGFVNNEISVIDTETDNIVTSFRIENTELDENTSSVIRKLVVNQTTNKIYLLASNRFHNSPGGIEFLDDSLYEVDGNSNKLLRVIDLVNSKDNVSSLAVNESANKLYLANTDGSISVLDGATGSFITNINLDSVLPENNLPTSGGGFGASGSIGIAPGFISSRVYINRGIAINSITNRIYVIDTISTSGSASSLAKLIVINGNTDSFITAIDIDLVSSGIAVNQATNKVYVLSPNDITVINGDTNVLESSKRVGIGNLIAINPTTNKIYVANSELVQVFDGNDLNLLDIIALGGELIDIEINPSTNKIYLANSTFKRVTLINGSEKASSLGQIKESLNKLNGSVKEIGTFSIQARGISRRIISALKKLQLLIDLSRGLCQDKKVLGVVLRLDKAFKQLENSRCKDDIDIRCTPASELDNALSIIRPLFGVLSSAVLIDADMNDHLDVCENKLD